MVAVKLQERGQFTIPARIRDAIGMKPGDVLLVRPLGPGRLEVEVLSTRPLGEFLKERAAGTVDMDKLRVAMGDAIVHERLAPQEETARSHG